MSSSHKLLELYEAARHPVVRYVGPKGANNCQDALPRCLSVLHFTNTAGKEERTFDVSQWLAGTNQRVTLQVGDRVSFDFDAHQIIELTEMGQAEVKDSQGALHHLSFSFHWSLNASTLKMLRCWSQQNG